MTDEERFERMGCLVSVDNDDYICSWGCQSVEEQL